MSSCPHCGGLLNRDYDGYEQYLVCLMCGRMFDLNGETMRMTPIECKTRYGVENILQGRYK